MDKPVHWRHSADPLTQEAKPTFAAVREDLSRVPLPRRIATVVFIILAILLARYSWETPIVVDGKAKTIPFAVDAERALYDMRALFASLRQPVDQDKRVLLIPFTPDTQRATGERSPLDRTTLANALTSLDTMGAKAIGVDILIDQAQPDDPVLVKALHDDEDPGLARLCDQRLQQLRRRGMAAGVHGRLPQGDRQSQRPQGVDPPGSRQ